MKAYSNEALGYASPCLTAELNVALNSISGKLHLGYFRGHYSYESPAVLIIMGKAAQSHFCLNDYLDLLLKEIQGRERRGDISGGTAARLLSCRLCPI